MNQFYDYKPGYSTQRISTGGERQHKPKMVADFNPVMSGFNKYYNDNKNLVTVIDQYYQDFNIINNTINGYSSSKPSPMQRRVSALETKEYRKKFNLFFNREESKAETKATEVSK